MRPTNAVANYSVTSEEGRDRSNEIIFLYWCNIAVERLRINFFLGPSHPCYRNCSMPGNHKILGAFQHIPIISPVIFMRMNTNDRRCFETPKVIKQERFANTFPRSSCTLTGQKYLNTTKYPCTDCAIYRLNIQLGTKMGIETCSYQKFVVLALALVKMFEFLTFHEDVNVLII